MTAGVLPGSIFIRLGQSGARYQHWLWCSFSGA